MNVQGTGLGTVLKVKQFQEKSAQKDLAATTIVRENEEQRLGELEQTKDAAIESASVIVRSNARDLQTGQAFLQSLSREIDQQGDRVDAARQMEDQKRTDLLEKKKSRQMVEKLDTKRRTEMEKEVDRKSQRVIDLLAQRTKRPGGNA